MIEYIVSNITLLSILFVSVTFLVFLIFGIVFLFKKMAYIGNQTSKLLELIENYEEHLNYINQADKLFGEPTIVSLLEHTKLLLNNIGIFLKNFEFMKVEEIIEEEEQDDESTAEI